jgi:hypothetical protein
LKLAGSTPEPAATAEPAPVDDAPPADASFGGEKPSSSSEKPFDDEPFDAGVEADEESDPKKFIEQLTGKLGQSLRKYNEEQGQPDFELEKFAINSLLSATHISEMDAEDQKDIISKVKKAGQGDKDVAPESDETSDETPSEEPAPESEPSDEEGLDELHVYENMDNLFVDPKKNNMFQPGSNDKLNEMKPCWKGYKQIGMKEKNGKEVPNCVPVNENMGGTNNYMFWSNLKTIAHATGEIIKMDYNKVDSILSDGNGWALDHVASASQHIEQVYHFLEGLLDYSNMESVSEEDESNNYMFWQNVKNLHHGAKQLLELDFNTVDRILSDGHGWALDHVTTATDNVEQVYHFIENEVGSYDGETEGGYSDEFGSVQNTTMNEAEYKGRTVKLGKPMKGDVKKFKVFVKNKSGKVVKVNFGDPNMEIKRDNPKRRKSFRARHKCSQAHDRTTPKYWSCRMWSRKPVSKIVENLPESKKSSIFDKNYLKMKVYESFNQNDTMNHPITEPVVKPTPTKPAEQPVKQPSRKDKPFLPMPEVTPDPKAIKK